MLAGLRAFAIPMPVKFRGVTVREGALVEGPAGWGEFSPFAEYGPRECARWLASALESAAGGWPAPVRDRIPVNVTVPAVGPEQAMRIVAASGCRTAKVKVAERGQAEAADIERVEAVREALGPSGRIRVDANGGWQTGQAVRMLRRLAAFGLEYAEQPCATLDELAEVRREVDIPVAADESIRRSDDPLRVRAAGAADIVVLKVQPLGGVRAALRVAEACGLPVVVSSAVDTSVGLAAGVALAAALPELPYACGLATMSLLSGDVTADPLVPEGGELPVRRPAVDAARLARFEIDPVPWRNRAAAAARFLGEGALPVNPSTAFGVAFGDELARCGLREVVLAPGSRSTPLAMAFGDLEQEGRLRLHVRIDERSASFTALGLAKASRRPVAVLCTSGTAAANFHPAVIEADESAVPLLVLTADRPPELRSTGANQAIDQIKLYGSAVRWFCEAGVPERRTGAAAYWRSLACQAWAYASGRAGGLGSGPGPVHLNLAFRDPLTPDLAGTGGSGGSSPRADEAGAQDWPESLGGRADGKPWTRFEPPGTASGHLELPWTERGVVICGDGDYDAAALVELAEQAGWPVLAEPSSGARHGPNALPAYQYLLATPEFTGRIAPMCIVSAGRPGLSRPQSAPPGRSGRPACGHRTGAGTLGGPAAGRHRRRRETPAHRHASRDGALAGRVAPGRRRGPPRGGRRPRRGGRADRTAPGPGPGPRAAGRRTFVGREQYARSGY